MERTRARWADSTLVRFAAVLALSTVGFANACAHDGGRAEPAVETAPAEEHATVAVVHSIGGAPLDASEMVDWALDRFAMAGLELPDRIAVTFDVSGRACDGSPGRCHPEASIPEAIVCERDGTSAFRVNNRRITLLHELAHIWHWHRIDGWSDESRIVGGVPGDGSVDWHDRTAERVAVVISWGLLETKRRPVETDLHCAELYTMFEQLTGRAPLGELETMCVPDGTGAREPSLP